MTIEERIDEIIDDIASIAWLRGKMGQSDTREIAYIAEARTALLELMDEERHCPCAKTAKSSTFIFKYDENTGLGFRG